MTVEELLKPRYKVIADYPDSEKFCKVGEILDRNWAWHDGEGNERLVSEYPHLFKKLEWWEDRRIEDMPVYVRDVVERRIMKVKEHFLGTRGDSCQPFDIQASYNYERLTPSSQQEYESNS
jgi:hypothetical protein